MGKAFYFYCVVGQRKAQKPNALALVVSSVMQTQLSMKPAGLVAPPENNQSVKTNLGWLTSFVDDSHLRFLFWG